MTNKRRVFIIVCFVLNLIFISNIANTQAITRGWNAGDIYTWGIENSQTTTIKYLLTEQVLSNTIRLLYDRTYNITSIDTLAQQYSAEISDFSGILYDQTFDYGIEEIAEGNYEMNSAFDYSYNWDFVQNKTVLSSFDFNIDFAVLVNPNWVKMNRYLKDIFNTSETIWTLADPYESIIHNITFYELMNNATSLKIMGVKDNINESKTKFTEETTQWSFEFDYSNVLYCPFGYYNETTGSYYYFPYDKYIITLEAKYSEDGILSNVNYEFESSITLDNITYEQIYIGQINRGGIKSLSANLSPILLLPSMFFLVMIVKSKRK